MSALTTFLLGAFLVLILVNLVCFFILVTRAFQKSAKWGLGVLCTPFVVFAFLVSEWDQNHKVGKIYLTAQILSLFAGGALEYTVEDLEYEMRSEAWNEAIAAEFPERDLAALPPERPEGPPTPASTYGFDLVPTAGGAVVIWAEPAIEGGRILGRAVGETRETTLAGSARQAPAIEELDAAVGPGGQVTIVWSERDGDELSIRGGSGAIEDRLESVFSLGRIAATETASRLLQVGYDGAVPLSLASGVEIECRRRQCRGAQLRQLRAARGTTVVGEQRLDASERAAGFWRDAEGLHVLISEHGRHGQRWRARVGLSRDVRLPDLDGCARAAVTTIGQTRAVAAQCDEARTVVTVPDGQRWGQPTELTCAGGKPTVLFSEGPSVSFDAPMADVQHVLPASVAAFGSVAVWTGAALLIATPTQGPLTIERGVCQGGELLRHTME